MTTKVIKCRIAVGKNAYLPQARVNALTNKLGSVNDTPWGFRCGTCKQEFGGTEVSVGLDLRTVSCSNCYSDDMYLIAIRISVPEDWELHGGRRQE